MHSEIIKPKKKVRGGVAVSHEKHTKDMPVKRIPAPEIRLWPVLQAVIIENDGENTQFEYEVPKADTKEEFLKAVRASGLVGLGGAGFPTHVKLNIPEGKSVDTLIINAAECEPYITVDYRECIDNSWDVFNGVHLLKDMLGVQRVVIAVEDNKPDAIKILERIAEKGDTDDRIKVMPLKSKYPQGAEKMMVLSPQAERYRPGHCLRMSAVW